jgi:cytochrome c5
MLYLSFCGFPVFNMNLIHLLHAQAETERNDGGVSNQAAIIYQKNCASCHDNGIMGAPKPGTPYLLKDIDTLVENAINGIGKMPARGHASFLSDDEIRSVVEYMVSPR